MAESEAGTRSVEPTARGLARARQRGDVPVSRDLTSAVVALAFLATVVLGGRTATVELVAYLRSTVRMVSMPFDGGAALRTGLGTAARLLAWPLGLALASAVAAGLIQTRGLVAIAAVRVDLARLIPSARRLFRPTLLTDLARTLAAMVLLPATAALTVAPWTRSLGALGGASARTILAALTVMAGRLGFNLALAALALGIIDMVWQRHRHREGLRQTPSEARREHKETEGDPLHRGERQRLRRERLAQGSPGEVRQASVVVCGTPGEAIALRYDPATSGAPIVISKGERLVAETMKQIAREAAVPIVVDDSLARALMEVGEGDPIGERLFDPVAQIFRALVAPRPGSRGSRE